MYRVSLKKSGQYLYVPDLDTFIYYGKDTLIDEETFDNSKNAREVRHLLNIESDGIDMNPEKNVVETETDLYSIVPREHMTVIVKNFNGSGTPITAMFYDNSWKVFGGSGGSGGGSYIHPSTHPATMITQDENHRFVTDEKIDIWDKKSDFSGDYNDLTNKPTIPVDTADLNKSDVYTKSEIDDLMSTVDNYDDTQLKNDLAILEAKLNNKVENSELSNYREKSVLISESDLTDAVKTKLNAAAGSSGSTIIEYDDTAIKADIADLETTVSGLETDLTGLETELANKADKTELDNKADKTELDNYREKSTLIDESDLSEAVKTKLNNAGSLTGYDDTIIKADIANLETAVSDLGLEVTNVENELDNKADKTELDSYREKSVLIDETDLTEAIKTKLNNAGSLTGYDDTAIKADIADLETTKADKTELTNYREKATLIGETDLSEAVKTKLNNAGSLTGYDDTAIKADIADLETTKADKSELANKVDKTELANYRNKSTLIDEADLSEVVKTKLNSSSYDDTEVKNDIIDLIAELDNKADKTELTGYREKASLIDEADLTEAVKTKLNNAGSLTGYDDTAIKADITDLEANKADKTELDNYREKATLIDEVDLTEAVKTKLNSSSYDDTEIKGDITDLEANKADKTELANYREKSSLIDEADLTEAVKTKLNSSSYDDTEIKGDIADLETNKADKTEIIDSHDKLKNLNLDENYLHITLEEKNKYDGYESIILDLQSLIQKLSDRVLVLEGGNPDTLWTFDFPLDGGVANYTLTEGVHNWSGPDLTNEDIYGPDLDGMNPTVKLYVLGPVASVDSPAPTDATPQEIPRDGLDELEPPTDHGAWSFNSNTQTISFAGGVMSPYYFRLVKTSK